MPIVYYWGVVFVFKPTNYGADPETTPHCIAEKPGKKTILKMVVFRCLEIPTQSNITETQ